VGDSSELQVDLKFAFDQWESSQPPQGDYFSPIAPNPEQIFVNVLDRAVPSKHML
jgi:hypothetical protein